MSQTGVDRAQMHKTLIGRLYAECLNDGRSEVADQLFSPEFVNPEGLTGPEGFKAAVAPLRRAFPDMHFTIQDLVAEGDRVAVRWTMEATHRAPLGGVAATGNRIAQHGIVIYRFQDRKIAESWVQVDRLGVLQQLGAVPETFGGGRRVSGDRPSA